MKTALIAAAFALAACGGSSGPATNFTATLSSANEVPPTQNPTTAATGNATYTVLDGGTAVSYTVTFSGMSSKPSAGHIHVGTSSEAGGVVVPFAIPADAGTSGTITGSFTGASVVGRSTPSQTIVTGDMNSMLSAMRASATYTNLHTTLHPDGEIRGQNQPH
jgi:CHRD domain-containing protein